MAVSQSQTQVTNKPTPQQINAAARKAVLAMGVRMSQPIFSQTFATPEANPTITIQPRNVGLILGFWLRVQAVITETGGIAAIDPTDFGPANLITKVSFTDLDNNERIACPAWYLELIGSLKSRRPKGSAITKAAMDTVTGYGNVFTVDSAAQVAKGGNQTWVKWLWVPLAYSENDLRGAIYANVTGASMQLTLSLNTSAAGLVAAPADDMLCVGTGSTGTITNVKIDVHQVYLDQLPRGNNGGLILPMIDLANVYELKTTQFTGATVGNDFPIDYPNGRDFLSTLAVHYNGAARLGGGDVNYWLLQSANLTNIWKQPADLCALRTRDHLGTDLPKGCYYFGSRNKPIATVQYGNMQLVGNFSIAGATDKVIIGFEDFALKNVAMQSGSLNAG